MTSSLKTGRRVGGSAGWRVIAVAWCSLATSASGQSVNPPTRQPADPPTWTVDGQVQLGKRAGPLPVANQWVVVHRIASDSAGKVTGGPLDSARSDARGRYRVRYQHPSGQATYIAITTFQGVSYISTPFTRPNVSGDDAMIMVFDTTAPPYPIHVAGRHLIITAPDSTDHRRIVDVYELLNDSVHTVMGTEANPVWRATLPDKASDVQINPVGDVSPAMTKITPREVIVFAPISPGLRQLSFSYTLGPEEFPLVMPVVDSTSVFELLMQETGAAVEGGGFTEVRGVEQEGVAFRRFLSQNVPARAVMRFSVPKLVGRTQSRLVQTVVIAASLVMLAALGFVFWWRGRSRPSAPAPQPRETATVDALIRELAAMDAEFERHANASPAERADFDARRDAIKARLNAALAGQTSRT